MLYRIEGMKGDAQAVYFKLSALKPANRTPKQMHVMMSLLEELLSKSRSRLFLMSDGDLFIVGRNIPHPLLQKTVASVRQLYQADPLVSMSADINFCEIFDLGYEFDSVIKLAQRKNDIAKTSRKKKEQKATANIDLSIFLQKENEQEQELYLFETDKILAQEALQQNKKIRGSL